MNTTKTKAKPLPEFMVRVKLPSSECYAACPSGDTEYEIDYKKAIADCLLPEFVPIEPKLGHRWPVDSEGCTFIPIRCKNADEAIQYWMDQTKKVNERLSKIEKVVNG